MEAASFCRSFQGKASALFLILVGFSVLTFSSKALASEADSKVLVSWETKRDASPSRGGRVLVAFEKSRIPQSLAAQTPPNLLTPGLRRQFDVEEKALPETVDSANPQAQPIATQTPGIPQTTAPADIKTIPLS